MSRTNVPVPDGEHVKQVAAYFHALACPMRLCLFQLLLEAPVASLAVRDLEELIEEAGIQTTQSSVSVHLRILCKHDLIVLHHRMAQSNYYAVTDKARRLAQHSVAQLLVLSKEESR